MTKPLTTLIKQVELQVTTTMMTTTYHQTSRNQTSESETETAPAIPLHAKKNFIISEEALDKLFNVCFTCEHAVIEKTKSTKGFASCLNLRMVSKTTFYKVQKKYVVPVVRNTWLNHQKQLLQKIKEHKTPLNVAGDVTAQAIQPSMVHTPYLTSPLERWWTSV